ncbi:hypothetical protein ACWCQ0_46300, partial [Streptomyces massasporeus]
MLLPEKGQRVCLIEILLAGIGEGGKGRRLPTVADEETVPALPATSWAVLGLLSFGRELSG